MVVLAAFLQSALVFGVIRSFGVFFVEFVTHFDELSGRISWITSIGIAVQQFASEWHPPRGGGQLGCLMGRE